MPDFVILGTDTEAGKTTFALLWLTAFPDDEYWKPIETGPPDSELVRRLLPNTAVHRPLVHFDEPVAPPLAARRANITVPSALTIAANRPLVKRPDAVRLIETFGGPFSPLNEAESQIDLLHALRLPLILVGSSAVGAIGRMLSCLFALRGHSLLPTSAIVIGPKDDYAVEQISRHIPTLGLTPPAVYTQAGLEQAVASQDLSLLRSCLGVDRESALTDDGLLDHDRKSVWHPYTPLKGADPPLPCVGAQDEFLHLADGRRVIDGISSWWTILHGHRHPPLLAALHEALAQIDHIQFAGLTHPWAIELAELLLSTMPWQGGRVFYSDNGSTAVEVALKMAYQFWRHQDQPQRRRFVGFEHGYHGDTFGAMAVSRDPVFFGQFEPLLFQADILPLSPERLDEHLSKLGNETAAVILEPLVQGAGGMRVHSPETLKQVFEIARRHDVVFIADEVMTGGGRTGTLWAFQAAGIAPDLICAGKTLAGGMLPLAATLASPRIVEAFNTADRTKTFFHGHSFTAHPLACAVAAANWRMLINEPPTAPARMEAFWREVLAPLHPRVREVRIKGTIAAVQVDVPGGYLAEVGRAMQRRCLEEGVFLRPLGNVLYAMPPFCTSADSLERIAQAMINAVESL